MKKLNIRKYSADATEEKSCVRTKIRYVRASQYPNILVSTFGLLKSLVV